VEFVGPSVTSPGIENPQEAAQTAQLLRAIGPHMKYIELNRHGYVLVDVDRDRAQGEWYHVDTIQAASRTEQFVAGYATANGANHLLPATTPSAPRTDAPDPAPGADGAQGAFATT
jgi:alkaline phosphatase D